MKAELWDDRVCLVGEGPVATGSDNSQIFWVDVLGQRILSKNLLTQEIGSWEIGEDVSFIVPRKSGGMVIGTATGPSIFYEDGQRLPLPTRYDADGFHDPIPMRWNDAKVAPNGDLWLGSMSYGGHEKIAGLYRLTADEKKLTRVVDKVQISNGLAWSSDSSTLFFIDSPTKGIDAFDYQAGSLSERRRIWSLDPDAQEVPDGMAIDSEGGLWVAFWNGSCLRRIDSTMTITEEIKFSNTYITSCAFAGPDLKTLVITTAKGVPGSFDDDPQAGMTFVAFPGVTGMPSTPFGTITV